MPDMLVKLYELPPLEAPLRRCERQGIAIRRPLAGERRPLVAWVSARFSRAWGAECEAAFAISPPKCFIALQHEAIIGFACHDCTCSNFFGPTGVAEGSRGRGVGLALLLSCLHAMRDQGYAYAVIGGVGPAAYYAKTVGATLIEGSTPGIYGYRRERTP
ncbi:MAG: GNAT family N-acetyltransferase [Desulfobacterales bacterium]|jgi:GNAT superfamily N-acetyltransferase|nr:GNAT family N-acetyltransferase [Desulfobacterales bacterium]